MKSIKTLYKIGIGPSSSHSMGPKRAVRHFLDQLAETAFARIEVALYGSLAATGKGHLTDKAISDELSGYAFQILWLPDVFLPVHPCGLKIKALDSEGTTVLERCYYSIGGGELTDERGRALESTYNEVYPDDTIEAALGWCRWQKADFTDYVITHEGADLMTFLRQIWGTMAQAVRRGLAAKGVLPGGLNLLRRACAMQHQAHERIGMLRDLNLLSAYALAVAEENAAGGTIVTAPTCGACGIVPAVLYYFHKHYHMSEENILRALATAGLFGVSVAQRASISGAEIGCQGEIGTACAMASAAAAQLLSGTPPQVEYAAEMALEHMLGLTCDPIAGLVQIPCIERNAFAAMRAMECACYALSTNGRHHVSFDAVVNVMDETGRDLQNKYKETALGGLAKIMNDRLNAAHK